MPHLSDGTYMPILPLRQRVLRPRVLRAADPPRLGAAVGAPCARDNICVLCACALCAWWCAGGGVLVVVVLVGSAVVACGEEQKKGRQQRPERGTPATRVSGDGR
jgi:hypothetical protein